MEIVIGDTGNSKIDNAKEGDIPEVIKQEFVPPAPTITKEESSDEISLFENGPGTRIFDKYISDASVASRIIKGINEFKIACSEAKGTLKISNSLKHVHNGEVGENADKTINSASANKTRTLEETLKRKKAHEKQDNTLPPLFTRIHQGLIDLYELIDDGNESVINVRVAAIRDEIVRQKNDEIERFNLGGYIAKKELEALEEYKKIDEKWAEIRKLKDPLNIHNETITQREKCKELLKEKDFIIQFLRDILKRKDNVFLKEVENQGNDIDILLDRIQNQIYIFKETYSKQLEALEEIIDEEKKVMIELNRAKWESLVKDKEDVDKAVLEKLTDIMDTHEVEMRLAEKEQNEHQRKIRSKLHKYINDLTLHVDHLKSVCTLNIEKITYNYQIILKKQQENQVVKQRCKRYASRIKNNLNLLRKEIKQGSKLLTDQLLEKANMIDKLQDKINAIDKRCDTFISSESKLFFDLWDFNERKANHMLEQIFVADKILHEKVLLLSWNPPVHTQLDKCLVPSYKEAKKLSEHIKKRDKVLKNLPKVIFESETQMERLTKVVFDNLKSSCPFFIDEQRKKDISHLSGSDRNLFELENVFEALGLKTKNDVDLMMKYFIPYITCGECLEESYSLKSYKEKQGELLDSVGSSSESIKADELLRGTKDAGLSLAMDSKLVKEEGREDFLLTDIVKDRLQLISNIVADETINFEEQDIKKFIDNEYEPIEYEGYSKILQPSITYSPETIHDDEILSAQEVFGLVEHQYWMSGNLRKMPKELSDNYHYDQQGNEGTSLFICSDPSHQPFVNPIDIAKALRDFTVDFYKTKKIQTNITMEEVMLKPRMSPSRILAPEDVSKYWQAYTNFVNPQKIHLWETLYYGLQDYHNALNRRHHLNLELKKLQRSNIELRRLLQRYIQKNPPVSKSEMLLSGFSKLKTEF